MTKEIWKDIKGYEGLYQVSNLGRVKSVERYVKSRIGLRIAKEKIKTPTIKDNGYMQVTLYEENRGKMFYVHRLVALHFIENPLNLPQINHKNEDKTCNEVWNLEWCNNQYNQAYSHNVKIVQYDLQGNFIKEWDSITDAETQLDLFDSGIVRCCQGKQKQCGGYIWKYKEK